jgi:ABC-type transport system involved in multi-copper enzyme maturation permease subunit
MSSSGTSQAVRAKAPFTALLDRQTWIELFIGGLLLAAAATVAWHRGQMSLPKQLALWVSLLLAFAVLLRRGWLRLFGPVLFYDLIRLGRRGRFFLLRCLYACALMLILYWTYEQFLESLAKMAWMRGPWGYTPQRTLQGPDLARLAEQFFFAFMKVQFLAILVLTPGYAAGAVAEEKDRKTLEFLLATDLSSREIVLSKLMARVANLTLLILTGLPILSLTQFLGGVDPNVLAAAFAASALSMLSLASFSILCSVHVRKPRDAILLTYLGTGAYLAVSFAAGRVTGLPPELAPLVKAFTAGNIFLAMEKLDNAVTLGTDLATVIPGLLRNYALFHGTFAVGCGALAVLRLRPVALRQPAQRVQKVPGRWRRPRVGRLPMIWKELFIEPGFKFTWVGWLVAGIAVLLSLAPAVYLAGDALLGLVTGYGFGPQLTGSMNLWARVTSTAVLCLMLIGVAVRAAGSITGERDRETMDGLLTSPLQSHDILFAKWLGSLLSVRWAWWWIGLIWAVGLVTGGMAPIAVPMQLSAWLVYAGTMAGLGLWYSTTCPTTMRATMWTLGVTGGLCVFHWLAGMFCCPAMAVFDFDIKYTLTPPYILGWLCVGYGPVSQNWEIGFVLTTFGLMGWAMVAAFLWSVTRTRFRMATARMSYRRPERWEIAASEYGRMLGQKY